MSIIQRLTTLIRANINDLIDKAEAPEKMIKQMITDMESSVRDAKVALAATIAEEKKLQMAYEENLNQSKTWYDRAELAVTRGDDELAKEALRRRSAYEETAVGLKGQVEKQREAVAQLREGVAQLESKLAEANAKKDLLIARQRRAQAEKKVNEQLAGMTKQVSAFETFDRMEKKVADLEAQAAAAGEITRDSLEDKFKALEKDARDQEVEDDLAALKAKLTGQKEEAPQ